MPLAEGNFDVQLTPSDGMRMTLDKDFRGDIVATSHGEMLAMSEADAGVMAYVALEKLEGTVDGRSGTFWLAHRGEILGEHSSLEVTVVPGSATGDLAGLTGSMTIDPADNHAYTFDYLLP